MIMILLMFIVAYLLGSVSASILLCKALGLPDPRTQGSGNPGATNVLRFGGKKIAVIVLLGDALKAAIPVFLAKALIGIPWVTTVTALCAFLGHVYPVFFQFKGGKGVASYIGGLLGVSWFLFIAAAVTWLGVAAATRYSSMASLSMAGIILVLSFINLGFKAAFPLIVMSALLVWRHKANIERLYSGQEPKIGNF